MFTTYQGPILAFPATLDERVVVWTVYLRTPKSPPHNLIDSTALLRVELFLECPRKATSSVVTN